MTGRPAECAALGLRGLERLGKGDERDGAFADGSARRSLELDAFSLRAGTEIERRATLRCSIPSGTLRCAVRQISINHTGQMRTSLTAHAQASAADEIAPWSQILHYAKTLVSSTSPAVGLQHPRGRRGRG